MECNQVQQQQRPPSRPSSRQALLQQELQDQQNFTRSRSLGGYYQQVCVIYFWLSNKRRLWNNRIEWTFASRKINVWYGIIVLGGKNSQIDTGHSRLEPFVLSVQSPASKEKFEFSRTLS